VDWGLWVGVDFLGTFAAAGVRDERAAAIQLSIRFEVDRRAAGFACSRVKTYSGKLGLFAFKKGTK
jgi:hypothetical protein